MGSWSAEVTDYFLDQTDGGQAAGKRVFKVATANDVEEWGEVLAHVAAKGKFDFVICIVGHDAALDVVAVDRDALGHGADARAATVVMMRGQPLREFERGAASGLLRSACHFLGSFPTSQNRKRRNIVRPLQSTSHVASRTRSAKSPRHFA